MDLRDYYIIVQRHASRRYIERLGLPPDTPFDTILRRIVGTLFHSKLIGHMPRDDKEARWYYQGQDHQTGIDLVFPVNFIESDNFEGKRGTARVATVLTREMYEANQLE